MRTGKSVLRLGLVPSVAWLLFQGVVAQSADESSTPLSLPPKEKLGIYLLMGQSNMAGAAPVGAEDRVPHPRILRFSQAGEWEVAAEPIHNGRKIEGMGPAFSFAKVMAEKHPAATIGLVPCAVGGTPLKRWERDGDLYRKAVARAKKAMQNGTLAGILWHQGEKDSTSEVDTASYGTRLAGMIRDIRADLNAPQLPVVVGQIGEFLTQPAGKRAARPLAVKINATLASIPSQVPATGCARSGGLKHKGDGVHFDTESQRELGRRFATEMLRLEKQQPSGS